MEFIEALEEYNSWRGMSTGQKTISGEDMSLRHFGIYMRNAKLEEIMIDDVLQYLKLYRGMGFDQNTFAKKTVAFRNFFGYLSRRGTTQVDPYLIPQAQREHEIPRVANDEDFRKFMAAIPEQGVWNVRNRTLCLMIADSGARIGEILSLDLGDIHEDLMGATIRTEKNKGSRPFRQIFWKEGTKKELQIWLAARSMVNRKLEFDDPDALFISSKGGTLQLRCSKIARRLKQAAVGEIFRKYSNKAGLPYNVNPHSLRHKLGRDLAKEGVNNSVISSMLGHSSLQSSYIYTELFGEDIKEEYRKHSDTIGYCG